MSSGSLAETRKHVARDVKQITNNNNRHSNLESGRYEDRSPPSPVEAYRQLQSASTKTECDCLNGWIKKQTNKKQNKTITYAKISPKMVYSRDIAGERRKEELQSGALVILPARRLGPQD